MTYNLSTYHQEFKNGYRAN